MFSQTNRFLKRFLFVKTLDLQTSQKTPIARHSLRTFSFKVSSNRWRKMPQLVWYRFSFSIFFYEFFSLLVFHFFLFSYSTCAALFSAFEDSCLAHQRWHSFLKYTSRIGTREFLCSFCREQIYIPAVRIPFWDLRNTELVDDTRVSKPLDI